MRKVLLSKLLSTSLIAVKFIVVCVCSCFDRAGLHPLDLEVGKWLRKYAPQIKPIVVMNKSESIGDSLADVSSDALALGFGEPTAISAETGLGMTALYELLRPLLEDYMVEKLNGK